MTDPCTNIRKTIADYLLGGLTDQQTRQLRQHTASCPNCAKYLDALEQEQHLFTKLAETLNADMSLRQDKVIKALENPKSTHKTKSISIWRIPTKNRITQLATAAAVIIIAAFLSITFLDKSISSARAAEVFSDAARALESLQSVHIKLEIRTVAHDNFELIGLDYDFVPNEIWKQFDKTEHGKWRIEKPGRIVVMDGESSVLLIRPKTAMKDGVNTGFVQWLKLLLDVDRILDSEILLAEEQGSKLQLSHEQGLDGRDKLIVTVEAVAQGEFYLNDWCKNSSIPESETRRIYRFDSETNFLELIQVFVHADDGRDVLVLETTEIKYNLEIDPATFTLELPEDVVWIDGPKELPDNKNYTQMMPREVAQAFFQACADEDWDEFVKLYVAPHIDQRLKDIMGGVEIVSIGHPFKSGLWPGWFVPYEIKRRNENRIKKYNLAVRYDKKAKRYLVTGGF